MPIVADMPGGAAEHGHGLGFKQTVLDGVVTGRHDQRQRWTKDQCPDVYVRTDFGAYLALAFKFTGLLFEVIQARHVIDVVGTVAETQLLRKAVARLGLAEEGQIQHRSAGLLGRYKVVIIPCRDRFNSAPAGVIINMQRRCRGLLLERAGHILGSYVIIRVIAQGRLTSVNDRLVRDRIVHCIRGAAIHVPLYVAGLEQNRQFVIRFPLQLTDYVPFIGIVEVGACEIL